MSEWESDDDNDGKYFYREYVEDRISGSIIYYSNKLSYHWFLGVGRSDYMYGEELTLEAAMQACDTAFLRFAAKVKEAADSIL